MYQEDAEYYDHQRQLVAIEDDRRRNGVWGASNHRIDGGPEWLPEVHGPGPDCDPED